MWSRIPYPSCYPGAGQENQEDSVVTPKASVTERIETPEDVSVFPPGSSTSIPSLD